jgi:hypothetical protein
MPSARASAPSSAGRRSALLRPGPHQPARRAPRLQRRRRAADGRRPRHLPGDPRARRRPHPVAQPRPGAARSTSRRRRRRTHAAGVRLGRLPARRLAGLPAAHRASTGFDAVFAGDLPMASGLSSSAAIEVVTAIALDALHQTRLERQQIALLAHRAETGFVGVRCGIMDQFASALGRAGQVLLLHCAGPRWEHVPFDPAACEVLVLDTKKPRRLAKSGFNERVAQCADGARDPAHARARPAAPGALRRSDLETGALGDGRRVVPPRAPRDHRDGAHAHRGRGAAAARLRGARRAARVPATVDGGRLRGQLRRARRDHRRGARLRRRVRRAPDRGRLRRLRDRAGAAGRGGARCGGRRRRVPRTRFGVEAGFDLLRSGPGPAKCSDGRAPDRPRGTSAAGTLRRTCSRRRHRRRR